MLIFITPLDWINKISSAWTGYRKFAEWLVSYTNSNSKTIVELGVDYGYSTFVFGSSLKNTDGCIFGIDLFMGDSHAGYRFTYDSVIENINIIVGDFYEVSKTWNKEIDILHINGLHTYNAVKSDFTNWSNFVKNTGIILFHDTAVQDYQVKDFFKELTGGYRAYFVHSAGLGIYTKNKQLYETILRTFSNVYDYNKDPF